MEMNIYAFDMWTWNFTITLLHANITMLTTLQITKKLFMSQLALHTELTGSIKILAAHFPYRRILKTSEAISTFHCNHDNSMYPLHQLIPTTHPDSPLPGLLKDQWKPAVKLQYFAQIHLALPSSPPRPSSSHIPPKDNHESNTIHMIMLPQFVYMWDQAPQTTLWR